MGFNLWVTLGFKIDVFLFLDKSDALTILKRPEMASSEVSQMSRGAFGFRGKLLSPETFSEPIFLSPKIFPQTSRTFPQNFSPSLSPRVEQCSLSSLAGGLSATYGRNLTE